MVAFKEYWSLCDCPSFAGSEERVSQCSSSCERPCAVTRSRGKRCVVGEICNRTALPLSLSTAACLRACLPTVCCRSQRSLLPTSSSFLLVAIIQIFNVARNEERKELDPRHVMGVAPGKEDDEVNAMSACFRQP